MGGVSVSTMVATGSDAIFSGNLRLDSNGGFASVSTSFRADVRAFGGLRVNFFPSSRRLLMYVNSSTLGAIRDQRFIKLDAGTSDSQMRGCNNTAPRCTFHRSARPEEVPNCP
jgi:hypothetical protein